MPNEKYIGDGVYAQLDPGRMIVLRTARGEEFYGGVHWIALEPEVLRALIEYAYEIGWGGVVELATSKERAREQRISDEEYARAEEDKQRERDAAEGFDED